MKKIFVIILSIMIANTFSTVVLAANHDATSGIKVYKQVVLNGDEPAPPPAPAPTPPPEPPKPY